MNLFELIDGMSYTFISRGYLYVLAFKLIRNLNKLYFTGTLIYWPTFYLYTSIYDIIQEMTHYLDEFT